MVQQNEVTQPTSEEANELMVRLQKKHKNNQKKKMFESDED